MQQTESTEIISKLPPEQLRQLLTQLLQQKAPGYQLDRITIPELCLKHHQNLISRELASETIRNYVIAYGVFQKWADNRGLIYADEVRYDHAEEFYSYLLKTPNLYQKNKFRKSKNQEYSRYTAIYRYKCIKAMFAFAVRRDHVMKNPFVNKVMPLSTVSVWWDDEYFNKLTSAIKTFAMCSNQAKTLLITYLIYNTGLRVGILMRIKRSDISINNRGEVFLTTDLKISKSSEIQSLTIRILDETTKEKLLNYIKSKDPEERIFARSQPMTAYRCYRLTLMNVCKRAGIPYLTPHKAKHGFVTKMVKAGLTVDQVCKLTGNKTPELVRKVYTHLFHEDVADMAYKILNKAS